MAKNYTVAPEVDDDEEFPEPKPTKQYKKSIGPEPRVVNPKQYDKPIGPERGSIFQRIADVAAPGLSGEARALGKKGVAKLAKGAIVSGVRNTGERVGSLVGNMAPPVWLQDVHTGKRGGKKKFTQVPGNGMPSWMFGGGMPWDQPTHKTDVERVIVTRVHADGSRTTTQRIPTQKRRSNKPDWIHF